MTYLAGHNVDADMTELLSDGLFFLCLFRFVVYSCMALSTFPRFCFSTL